MDSFIKEVEMNYIKEIHKKGPIQEFDKHIIFSAVVGSTAHNTYIQKEDPSTDDIDINGLFIESPEHTLGLKKIETWTQTIEKYDVTYHTLRKYASLLLKSNPNVIVLMYIDPKFIIQEDIAFTQLRTHKDWFQSINAYDSFMGYSVAQQHRMKNYDLNTIGDKRRLPIEKFGYSTKEAAHCIRILRMGIEYVTTGSMTVFLPEEIATLIKDIKLGKLTLKEVEELIEHNIQELRKAKEKTVLPEKADFEKCSELVTDLTLDFWKRKSMI